MEHLYLVEIYEWVCGELLDSARADCREHLAECPACRRAVLEAEALKMFALEAAGAPPAAFLKQLGLEIRRASVAEQLAEKTAAVSRTPAPPRPRRPLLAPLSLALGLAILAAAWVYQEPLQGALDRAWAGLTFWKAGSSPVTAPAAEAPNGLPSDKELGLKPLDPDTADDRAAKEMLKEHSRETYQRGHHKKKKRRKHPAGGGDGETTIEQVPLGADGLPEVDLHPSSQVTP